MRKEHIRRVIDTLIIALAIILYWRGVWGLADLYLFPSNHTISYIISICIGIIILYTTKKLVKVLV